MLTILQIAVGSCLEYPPDLMVRVYVEYMLTKSAGSKSPCGRNFVLPCDYRYRGVQGSGDLPHYIHAWIAEAARRDDISQAFYVPLVLRHSKPVKTKARKSISVQISTILPFPGMSTKIFLEFHSVDMQILKQIYSVVLILKADYSVNL